MKDIKPAALRDSLARLSTPAAVVFARTGSAPSDELVAALAQVEPQLGDRYALLRVDLDAADELVAELRIHKEPELLVWAPGGARLIARMEGAMRPSEVLDLLEVAATRV